MIKISSYPAYKDSGVPWLGQLPAHWEVCSLGSLTTRVSQRGQPTLPLLSVVRERGVILRASMTYEENHNFVPDDLRNYQVVHKGNLVINKMKAWQGSLGVSVYDGIVSPAYFVFELQVANGKFAHSLLRSYFYATFFAQASDGVRIGQWDLSIDGMKRIPLFLPPEEEQAVIVRFLDHMDRRIQRYIRAKQRLIKLLEEQKQAIIHEAVTRGLDPNVRLKPSGVDWLGDVPEHWGVVRLRYLLTSIDQGVSPQAEPMLAENGTWGVLKAGCVNRGVFRDTEHKRLLDGFHFDASLAVQIGDVIVSRASGSPALVGSVGRVDTLRYQLILSDKTFRLNFREPRFAGFAVAAMNTPFWRNQVEQAISGAEGLANNLPLSSLKDFILVVPPAHEAERIATSTDNQTTQITATIARAERQISLIREYRTRLIADVVTGKLDVREAAAGLPDEFDEPEDLDLVDEVEGLLDEEVTEDVDLEAAEEVMV